MNKVLILGGYGNFGKRISIALAKANIPIIIAGRDGAQAQLLFNEINNTYPNSKVETAVLDTNTNFATQLEHLKPVIVVNTVGPFQMSDYSVVTTCIEHKVHYIDLADGRDFVAGITCLNEKAKQNNVLVVSGASTVPGLSSAVLNHYQKEFSKIESLIYGISPGQKAPRGVATAKSILSYLGKPLKPFLQNAKTLYGWQDLYRQDYPNIGKRWMANCDVPDLSLFPEKYGINYLRFSAGMENSFLHLGMWLVSFLVRFGLPINLSRHAQFFLRVSNLFNCFGTPHGGMHMLIKGRDKHGKYKEINWFIIAKDGDGPQIPCVPAIILTKKLYAGTLKECGAIPCIGLITLEEYMNELNGFAITQLATEIDEKNQKC